jgi:hypothetical protein
VLLICGRFSNISCYLSLNMPTISHYLVHPKCNLIVVTFIVNKKFFDAPYAFISYERNLRPKSSAFNFRKKQAKTLNKWFLFSVNIKPFFRVFLQSTAASKIHFCLYHVYRNNLLFDRVSLHVCNILKTHWGY